MFKTLLKPLQGLQWKLTLSYTLVTVGALLMVQILATVFVWFLVINSNIYARALIAVVKEELAPQIALYLDAPEPDVKGLAGWLQAAETSAGLTLQSLNFPVAQISLNDFDENTNLLVLDKNLNLLAGVPATIQENYHLILDQADKAIAAAASGLDDPDLISQIIPKQSMIIAVPLVSETEQLLGIVVLKTVYPPKGILIGLISYIGGSLIFFTIAAGVVGTLFGFITARGLTRRIKQVIQATDHWSQGDFSTFIQERSKDELGYLARSLNRMAEQLQNMLHTRQELAAMEERNRLALDLHDGVKQQVFATAMQLGAARASIEQDPKIAIRHLNQAEQLAREAQKELTVIIRELHQTTLKSKGLAPAIRELLDDWSRLNKITVHTAISDEGKVPIEIEQAIFRVVQEALANIAKHSQATHVEVDLTISQDGVSMMISDNGRGFDLHAVEGKGIGLRSMRERIESSGGDFSLISNPGSGTRISTHFQIYKEDTP